MLLVQHLLSFCNRCLVVWHVGLDLTRNVRGSCSVAWNVWSSWIANSVITIYDIGYDSDDTYVKEIIHLYCCTRTQLSQHKRVCIYK